MITGAMTIEEVIRSHPETIAVFRRYGLPCTECQIAALENIDHGASVHHIDRDELLAQLNRAIGVG